MTDKTPEALEVAEWLEQDQGRWHSRAPQLLRCQHQRIEELESALNRMPNIVRDGIADYVADTMAIRKHSLKEIDAFIRSIEIRPETLIARALSTTQQEDSQA